MPCRATTTSGRFATSAGVPDDCWHPIWGRPPDETFEAAKFREVFTRQIEIPPSLPPIAVRSAFGGLGIYRLAAALAARYRGVDAEGRETSEHVAFNTAIGRAGGRLHIFPALQVHAPRQHLYQPSDFKWRWRMTMTARRAAEIARPPWRRMLGSDMKALIIDPAVHSLGGHHFNAGATPAG